LIVCWVTTRLACLLKHGNKKEQVKPCQQHQNHQEVVRLTWELLYKVFYLIKRVNTMYLLAEAVCAPWARHMKFLTRKRMQELRETQNTLQTHQIQRLIELRVGRKHNGHLRVAGSSQMSWIKRE
jgi:hypothetical protein